MIGRLRTPLLVLRAFQLVSLPADPQVPQPFASAYRYYRFSPTRVPWVRGFLCRGGS